MFRLVADITELNIDQVKLPKIPGLGMLMKLPNKQKISMIVSVLNSQKGQFLPKWQEAVNQKWGQLQLLDYQVEQPGDGSCLARIRIDVGNADYDKAIDSVIPHVFQEKDAHTVLGEDYAGSGNLRLCLYITGDVRGCGRNGFLPSDKCYIRQRQESIHRGCR